MTYKKIILITFLFIPLYLISQEKAKDSVVDKPQRPAFESSYIIENPTNILFNKNTLEVQISHRFGLINGGNDDLAGIWAPSNIRFGLTYAIHERLTIGFGTTKFNRLQDINWKVAILRQTRSNKIPVNVSYYGNFAIDARNKKNFNVEEDRYSYFHQIIIARRISPKLSLQIAPSVSHYNVVRSFMDNDRFAVALGGRLKISPQTSIMVDYSQPLNNFGEDPDKPNVNYNNPGMAIGVEFATSGHAFQLFISNYNGIVPQKNYMENTNDFFDGDFLIGFNITRNYNF